MSKTVLPLRTIAGLALSLLFSITILQACAHTETRDNFDLRVRKSEDVVELKQLEASLAITPEKVSQNPDFQISENIAVPYAPEYRLGSGDVIEIVYHISYGKTQEAYKLEVQDKISITFPYHPQFSTTGLIRTDGMITVPLLGDVEAESKTPEELAVALNRGYSKYLNNPSITISLEEFNVKIDELKKAITTAPRGQSKIAPITTDGRISFPLIGNLQAAGLTLGQLEKAVNEKYAPYVRNLKVTLIALEIHHPKFYILGEVEKPGAYEMQSPTRLFDALALAGGTTTAAYLKDVVIFRNDGLERPIAFKVDAAGVFKTGSAFANLLVKPADIIYVPQTRLDRTNMMLEKIFTKGIYAAFPFNAIFSFGPQDARAYHE